MLKYFAAVDPGKIFENKNNFVLKKKQYYIFKTSEDTFHYLKNTKFVQLKFICVYLQKKYYYIFQ